MKKIEILASVDDGDRLDMTLGDMLLKYNIPTTFYIAPDFSDLDKGQIRCLSRGGRCLAKNKPSIFEIGAHTMTHPQDLKRLSDEEAFYEIDKSRRVLEAIIGKPVTKFCYPRGRFDQRIKDLVKKSGLKEARTTKVMNIAFPTDPFETNPTVHIYPDRKEYKGLSWKEVAEVKLDEVLKNGGRFEIWMHSWEVERYHFWEFLDDFLWYMNEEMKKYNIPRKI